MSETTKGTLPYGWVVKTSKHYKDRIYYFNMQTGASTWECPVLDPPSSVSKEQKKSMDCLSVKSDHINKSDSDSLKISEDKDSQQHKERSSSKSPCFESKTPPTAVVVPVVHKRNSDLIVNKTEEIKRKLTNENLTDVQNKRRKTEKNTENKKILLLNKSDNSEKKSEKIVSPLNRPDNSEKKSEKQVSPLNRPDNSEKKRKKKTSPLNRPDNSEKKSKKKILPLNRSGDSEKKSEKILPLNRSDDSEDILPHDNKEDKNSSLENSLSSPTTSSLEISNDIKDVEMRDVSLDIMDDLTTKKETVFDTTACYYIVVDTNVLISELHLISELKDTPLDGCGPPHIFIPWIVIEELDKLKNQRNAKSCTRGGAAEAIRYLNSVLSKHPRFHGQSPAEAEEWSKSYSKNNDDKILECCEALMDKMPPEKVILLTNDKNLVNKALICKINVHNFESMMKKVIPDTVFNYEELKKEKSKKKAKEKKSEAESASASISQNIAEERFLRSQRDVYKCEIHTLMSNARLLLKDVLSKFLEVEMFEAYGSVWLKFPIERNLLKGILEAIKKYWKMVFSEFFTEKDQRNFELLLAKASRPEGYLGDKEDCLVILSAIEDVFQEVKKRRPTLRISLEMIKEYHIACVNAFAIYNEADNSLRTHEEKSVLKLFDDDWVAMNQLVGVVLDFYGIPNDFNYEKFNGFITEAEVQRILISLYPEIQQIKRLMCNLLGAVKNCKPTKAYSRKLAEVLLQFIPTLRVPYVPETYPFFSPIALERFFANPQYREKIEIGINQAEKFFVKLDEVLCDMLRGRLSPVKLRPEAENMMCD